MKITPFFTQLKDSKSLKTLTLDLRENDISYLKDNHKYIYIDEPF